VDIVTDFRHRSIDVCESSSHRFQQLLACHGEGNMPSSAVPDGAPRSIARLLATSDPLVNQVDVSRLYTNEFALSK
jgi:hypothetical protein